MSSATCAKLVASRREPSTGVHARNYPWSHTLHTENILAKMRAKPSLRGATVGKGHGARRGVAAGCFFAVVAMASVDALAAEDGEAARPQDARRPNDEIDAEIANVRRDLAAEEAKLDDISKAELYAAVISQPLRVRLVGDGPGQRRRRPLAGKERLRLRSLVAS